MLGGETLEILVGTEGDSLPLMDINASETEASELWDYVLVADRCTQRNPRQVQRRQQFLEELERKGFCYKVREDQEKVFFGIRADNGIFDRYCRLLVQPEDTAPRGELARLTSIPATTRIRIVNFVLNSKTAAGDRLQDLVKDGVFEAGFPLHKGEEDLKKKWARWRTMFQEQPVGDIRNYFGEKVALYFAWLGWYTYMLVPAALVGLVVFLSGFAHFEASQISREICAAHDIYICPRSDHNPTYHRLSETCAFAKLTHLFDNEGTVLFAIFMALWATVFLELWKRERACVVLQWDLYGWDEDEEDMALGLTDSPDYQLRLHQHSYLRSAVVFLLSLLMICFMIGMAHLLVVSRVVASALFSSALPFLGERVTTAVVVTGALVHYVSILIMTKRSPGPSQSERGRSPSGSSSCNSLPTSPPLSTSPSSWAVPSQRLHDGPVRANGHHHGSETDAQQLHGVPAPVAGPQMSLDAGHVPGPRAEALAAQLPPEPGQHFQPVRRVHGDDDPVRLHHDLRGCLPTRPTARTLQQSRGDPPGRHQDGPAAAAPGATQGQGHRYRDYGTTQNSSFTEQSWFLLAIRLAFLILFEHVALCIKLIAAWFVPDVPQSVKNEVLKKKYQRLWLKSSSPKSTDV
ncbi:anoctamin-9 isoform X11 [Hippopotamus amphibius kiboko]|uniref:anoctamin-9 isoform X11 n=1 Tax=Hippopotamus amphibius kiboko TaxID=575201 RepID=UPI002596BC7E|nr:anoctamin-9 isoform X11 [Hippopotamus amphibius kiboko]